LILAIKGVVAGYGVAVKGIIDRIIKWVIIIFLVDFCLMNNLFKRGKLFEGIIIIVIIISKRMKRI
jgi:hypothetical protein